MYLLLILLVYFDFSCDIMLSLYFVYMLAGFMYIALVDHSQTCQTGSGQWGWSTSQIR